MHRQRIPGRGKGGYLMRRQKIGPVSAIIYVMVIIAIVLSIMGSLGGDADSVVSMLVGICVFATVIGVVFILIGAKKSGTQGKKSNGIPSFRSNAKDHEHITMASIGHDKSHELQQLDTMLEAGLIDNKEYQERLERIRKQAQTQVQQGR